MTKIPLDLLDKLGKPDFNKDGYCFANVTQQKSCMNYKKVEGVKYEICKWQGIGTVCDWVKE